MEPDANKPLVVAVIITFVVAFWFGFLVGLLITGRSGRSVESPSQNEENQISLDEADMKKQEARGSILKGTNTGIGTIQAEDQLAGKRALVSTVALEREGWIVIHEDKEGRPGVVLGATWLPAGSHENVEVNLLRGMEAGRRYYAMLHHEVNGDGSHLFDLDKDLPFEDAQGNIIMTSFQTISSPR